jgi:hypothetical protein
MEGRIDCEDMVSDAVAHGDSEIIAVHGVGPPLWATREGCPVLTTLGCEDKNSHGV